MTDAAAAGKTRYVLDARGSRVTAYGYAAGLLSAVGHDPVIAARDLSGDVQFDAARPDQSSVHLRIATGSLAVQNDVNEKDRREMERTMQQQVLDTASFTEIAYEATGAKVDPVDEGRFKVEADGRLTLHGITRGLRIAGRVFVLGDTLRAQGEATIRQTDYGIKPVSVAGGTLKLKDDVKVTFDVLARKAT
jgi:polyisoprenoid-binding protein YceI